MMAALVAGVADPFDMSDADLARVKELLARQKSLLKFYWSDDTVIKAAISSGDVVATSMWSDTFRSLKQKGVPVSFMRPKEGILSWCCGLVLARSATEVDAAYDLIDAVLTPSTGVKWIERGSNHANRKTYELIDETRSPNWAFRAIPPSSWRRAFSCATIRGWPNTSRCSTRPGFRLINAAIAADAR